MTSKEPSCGRWHWSIVRMHPSREAVGRGWARLEKCGFKDYMPWGWYELCWPFWLWTDYYYYKDVYYWGRKVCVKLLGTVKEGNWGKCACYAAACWKHQCDLKSNRFYPWNRKFLTMEKLPTLLASGNAVGITRLSITQHSSINQ